MIINNTISKAYKQVEEKVYHIKLFISIFNKWFQMKLIYKLYKLYILSWILVI